MTIAPTLIAVSLLVLAALGIAGLFLSGSESRSANDDDPDPRK